jgi:transcriptional regulator with XRE-family HTH domain
MPNIYGPHIKAVREKKGVKAAYVAARIRVSPPTYSQIESGQRGLSAERLRSIIKTLGMTLEEMELLVGPLDERNRYHGTPAHQKGGQRYAV